MAIVVRDFVGEVVQYMRSVSELKWMSLVQHRERLTRDVKRPGTNVTYVSLSKWYEVGEFLATMSMVLQAVIGIWLLPAMTVQQVVLVLVWVQPCYVLVLTIWMVEPGSRMNWVSSLLLIERVSLTDRVISGASFSRWLSIVTVSAIGESCNHDRQISSTLTVVVLVRAFWTKLMWIGVSWEASMMVA